MKTWPEELSYRDLYFPIIMNDWMDWEDINDMIVGGISLDRILDIINKNTFNGLQARLKINQWKRI